MKINLNEKVTVVLTSYGKDILDNYRKEKEVELHSKTISGILSYDKDGKFTTVVWELMNLFGEHLHNGCNIPFKDNELELIPSKLFQRKNQGDEMTMPKEKEKRTLEMIEEIRTEERFIENEIIRKQILLDENRKRRSILQEYLEVKMEENEDDTSTHSQFCSCELCEKNNRESPMDS